MTSSVNFLPWRQRRRRACLRFWGVMFGASAALALAAGMMGYATRNVNGRVDAQLLQAENQRMSALTAIKPHLQRRQMQTQQAIAQEKRRKATRRWQSALRALAQHLPEQAWLTKIEYRQSTLALSGKTLTYAALSALETTLRGSRTFVISHTGGTRQNEQRHWLFEYRLTERDTHDSAL
ncbi:PilN domain-containing protein [Citrobacter sedlakii]|uniref:PilN domain-containing protein n=1 Tax=Citrobacter TaxID=544 RepID=UPI001969C3D5|nr:MULTISPECIES: PilN domain-containing protein [Citrobacter]MBM9568104.1 PilN domain-containing protein [Citrobacter sedlakii]HBL4691549.1 PilN domain-containing protein [Citrobacter sedlakii]HBL4706863.1 PilN domain-containing protein [Citrobacter sedlakii]HBL4720738.1 PilN domain-containing protein [Citrobacter sedlakii]HCA7841688.1 PilN domain-containing protein [Citrobacter sedlakii]